jgi:hypothetical protein
VITAQQYNLLMVHAFNANRAIHLKMENVLIHPIPSIQF